MFAEFLGRETGYCRGRGGSMHIADPARGNLGANGIVGGGLPIAVGAALQRQETARPARSRSPSSATAPTTRARSTNRSTSPRCGSCRSFSSARTINMRCRWRSRARPRSPTSPTAPAPMRMPGVIVDGNDFAAVAEAVLRGDRPGARRRGADADRGQDLSHPRPFALRPQSLPHAARRSRPGARAIRSRRFETEIVALGLIDRASGDRRRRRGGRNAKWPGRSRSPSASPWPSTDEVTRRRLFVGRGSRPDELARTHLRRGDPRGARDRARQPTNGCF